MAAPRWPHHVTVDKSAPKICPEGGRDLRAIAGGPASPVAFAQLRRERRCEGEIQRPKLGPEAIRSCENASGVMYTLERHMRGSANTARSRPVESATKRA